MRRFTILGLMGLVLGVAVADAALRNAYAYWAGGLMLATALLIGVVTLGAVYHSGRRRASRLGFAVFGGGDFALVSGVSGDTSTRWKSLLPGAVNYAAFRVVGHCLFALLAGLLVMIIARRYQAWRERAMETDPDAVA